jgi:hypothetical protein
MNRYGARAKSYMAEYRPHQYQMIEDKEAYFTEIGEEAQRQVSSTFSKLSRPALGETDQAARMMAEELVAELIYPGPPEEPEESMDPTSAMAFSIRVQQDLWSEMDSDRPGSTTLPPLER